MYAKILAVTTGIWTRLSLSDHMIFIFSPLWRNTCLIHQNSASYLLSKLWFLLVSVIDLIEQNSCRRVQGDKKEFVFWRCRFFFDNTALIFMHIFYSPFNIFPCNSVQIPTNFSLSSSVVIRSTPIHTRCHLFIKRKLILCFYLICSTSATLHLHQTTEHFICRL